MITLRNNPVYVNRVQESWQQGGGVSSSSAGDDPFAQLGPTLDLVFAGVPNNLGENGPSLDLYFYPQQYQIAVQYSVWE
jgi:hypothetical protein